MNSQDNTIFGSGFYFRGIVQSLAINLFMGCVAAFLVFHGRPSIPLWGMDGIAFDVVPMTFLMTAMTAIGMAKYVDTRLNNFRSREAIGPLHKFLRPVLIRAVACGLVCLLIAGPLTVGFFTLVLPSEIGWSTLLTIRVIHVLILSNLLTPILIKIAVSYYDTQARKG